MKTANCKFSTYKKRWCFVYAPVSFGRLVSNLTPSYFTHRKEEKKIVHYTSCLRCIYNSFSEHECIFVWWWFGLFFFSYSFAIAIHCYSLKCMLRAPNSYWICFIWCEFLLLLFFFLIVICYTHIFTLFTPGHHRLHWRFIHTLNGYDILWTWTQHSCLFFQFSQIAAFFFRSQIYKNTLLCVYGDFIYSIDSISSLFSTHSKTYSNGLEERTDFSVLFWRKKYRVFEVKKWFCASHFTNFVKLIIKTHCFSLYFKGL